MKLSDFRKTLDLSQEAFGAKIGLPASTICNAERGPRFVQPETILKIMQYSLDPKTGKPRVDANDIFRAWCEANGHQYPGG